jgi:hypothetical protein
MAGIQIGYLAGHAAWNRSHMSQTFVSAHSKRNNNIGSRSILFSSPTPIELSKPNLIPIHTPRHHSGFLGEVLHCIAHHRNSSL